MGVQQQIGIAPMPAVARVLAQFDRDQLASFVEVAIGLLDVAAGDPDLENATDLEDDHALSPHAIGYATGPGCEISDKSEHSWVEWTTMRGSQKRGPMIATGHEDDEDDDPDTSVEDGAFDPEEDRCTAGDDGCGPVVMHGAIRWGAADDEPGRLPPTYGIDQSRGPISPTH